MANSPISGETYQISGNVSIPENQSTEMYILCGTTNDIQVGVSVEQVTSGGTALVDGYNFIPIATETGATAIMIQMNYQFLNPEESDGVELAMAEPLIFSLYLIPIDGMDLVFNISTTPNLYGLLLTMSDAQEGSHVTFTTQIANEPEKQRWKFRQANKEAMRDGDSKK